MPNNPTARFSRLDRDLILILHQEGPLHGYGLRKAIVAFTDGEMSPTNTQVYYSLGRLMELGLVELTQERSTVGPPKKVYQLNAEGQRESERLLQREINFLKRLGAWDPGAAIHPLRI